MAFPHNLGHQSNNYFFGYMKILFLNILLLINFSSLLIAKNHLDQCSFDFMLGESYWVQEELKLSTSDAKIGLACEVKNAAVKNILNYTPITSSLGDWIPEYDQLESIKNDFFIAKRKHNKTQSTNEKIILEKQMTDLNRHLDYHYQLYLNLNQSMNPRIDIGTFLNLDYYRQRKMQSIGYLQLVEKEWVNFLINVYRIQSTKKCKWSNIKFLCNWKELSLDGRREFIWDSRLQRGIEGIELNGRKHAFTPKYQQNLKEDTSPNFYNFINNRKINQLPPKECNTLLLFDTTTYRLLVDKKL